MRRGGVAAAARGRPPPARTRRFAESGVTAVNQWPTQEFMDHR